MNALERLFAEALAIPPDARNAFVEAACRGDHRLRAELMSLLEQADAAEGFFDLLQDAVFTSRLASGAKHEDAAQSSDSELHAGDMVGQYRIVSQLGSGGMGRVYRAHDTRLDRDVALKFLPPSLGADRDAEERLRQEARAAAALEHPNVCTIHEIGEADDGRQFIAMSCYDGETLKERLRRVSLSVEESAAIAVQVARGLAAAHSRGIIHRDVKPANVMLGADGTVRLLDFGVAVAMRRSMTMTPATPGTIAYMSPEQFRGEALDSRTDLWSLGVVLYEMLAGVRPFRGSNVPSLIHAILHEEAQTVATRRPEVPDALARVTERLLQKDPTARYSGAAEVLEDLHHALPSRTERNRTAFLTKRRAALLATVTVLFAVVGTLAWPRSGGEDPGSAFIAGARMQPSIAVLPLANLGADPEDAVLAHRMTEELITTLASTGDVRVISSTSVLRFRDREIDTRAVADSLGVSNILVGGLQRTGTRLRVQVRLIAAHDGSTRWSHVYDRAFTEVFAVQEEIARAAAGELGLRFDKDRQLVRHGTRSLEAYGLYLRASDPALLRGEAGIWKAQEYYRQAIAADSTYAAAHAGLALVYVRRARNANDPGMPLTNLLELADAAARRAIALDDSLAEAHYTLGRVREAMLEFPSAEAAIRRAIALDPVRSVYRRSLSYLHAWAGRPEEELEEARRSLETDPLNPYAQLAVAGGLYANRRYDEALAHLERVAAVQPPLQGAAFSFAQVYAKKQMWPEAINALRPGAEAGDPFFIGLLGYMLARGGQRDEANRILDGLIARRDRTGGGTFQIAVVYVGMRDFDRAFAWLDTSVTDRSIGSFIMGPTFEDLHDDPRFGQLRARLGLPRGTRPPSGSE